MTPFRSTLVLASALLLAGCQKPQQVYLAPGVQFTVCAPEDGPELFVTQEVVFQLPGGRRDTALAAVENRGGTFSLVASTPLGQTLFVVKVRGAQVTVDKRIPLPGDLDPRMLPALVQFTLWPAEAVRRNLAPGLELVEDGPRRSLLRKGRTVWTVLRDGAAPPYKTLVLENPSLQLTVNIRTLEP